MAHRRRCGGKAKYQLLHGRSIFQCAYCKFDFPFFVATVDHVIPYCQGGSGSKSNLTLACAECNLAKGSTRCYVPSEREMHVRAKQSEGALRVLWELLASSNLVGIQWHGAWHPIPALKAAIKRQGRKPKSLRVVVQHCLARWGD